MTDKDLAIKAEFSRIWLEFATAHEKEMQAGDWTHIFAVLTGTALAMADVNEEGVKRILASSNLVAHDVYAQAIGHLKNTPTIH